MKKTIIITLSFIFFGIVLTCCGPSEEEIAMMLSNTQTAVASEWTLTPSDTPTKTPTPTKEPTNTPLPTNTPTPTVECIPGNSFTDKEGDVSLSHIDFLKAETTLEATKLTVVLYLKEIPEEITINRNELEKGFQEYLWAVHIDTDNDITTGGRQYGAEYSMQVFTYKWGVERTGSFDSLLSADIWKNEKDSSRSSGVAQMIVDYDADTITLTGYIPGITSESRLYFETFDANPGGNTQWDEICTDS